MIRAGQSAAISTAFALGIAPWVIGWALNSHAIAAPDPPRAVPVLPQAVPVDGAPFQARLAGIDADWTLHFLVGETPRNMPAADLICWGAFVDAAAGPQLLLAGGGLLIADVLDIDSEFLQADAELFGPVKLPLEQVAGILFHPPTDRARRDALSQRVLNAKGETDRLFLDNGDELPGTVAGLKDQVLTLETASGKLPIEIGRVSALVFNPSLAAKARPVGVRSWIGFRDGSRVLAAGLSSEGGQSAIKLAGGSELKTRAPAGRAGSADKEPIAALQPLGGRATYLSDLPAASNRHVPYLQLAWTYRGDRSVLDRSLRAAGRLYLKGLGLHSAARLTYDLDKTYRRLDAELAIDDETQSGGSVECRVFIDLGDGKWQPRYASPVIRGGAAPAPISVDLKGAKRISLLVDFADHGDQLDHVDWLNARLVK